MEELAVKVLGPLGLSGLVILALAITVFHLFRTLSKVNEQRLADVGVLIKALDNNTMATRDNASAILARNVITEEQGRIIERQASVFELFMQKADMHDDIIREKLTEFKLVIDSLAEANRTNTGILRDMRDRKEL